MTRRVQGKPEASIKGEKVVKETNEALPVKPAKGARPGPTDPAAIDRRHQIVEDEPKKKSR